MATQHKPDMIFVLSIDTEEEWDWSGEFPDNDFSVENVQKLPQFQSFCEGQNIRPTYFVDYAVADNSKSANALKTFSDNNHCEIGAHLHPWCNPPYFGKTGEKESHVINLPIEQVEQKLNALIKILHQKFNIMPKSFRTGRWGIDSKVLQLLVRKGFQIDSSMYPFYKNEFFDCEKSSLVPYWPDYGTPLNQGAQRNIMEFPVTVGFNRTGYTNMLKVHNALSSPRLDPFHLIGLLWHSKLLRKLYLSPEVTSGQDMKPLIDFAINNHHPVIHMYMHSSSLIDGATGFMPGKNTYETICDNIQQVIDYAREKANIKFCTISEAACILKQRTDNAVF
jgi:hypothetical protein